MKYEQFARWLKDNGMDLSPEIRIMMETTLRHIKDSVINGNRHIPVSGKYNVYNAALESAGHRLKWVPFEARLAKVHYFYFRLRDTFF